MSDTDSADREQLSEESKERVSESEADFEAGRYEELKDTGRAGGESGDNTYQNDYRGVPGRQNLKLHGFNFDSEFNETAVSEDSERDFTEVDEP